MMNEVGTPSSPAGSSHPWIIAPHVIASLPGGTRSTATRYFIWSPVHFKYATLSAVEEMTPTLMKTTAGYPFWSSFKCGIAARHGGHPTFQNSRT